MNTFDQTVCEQPQLRSPMSRARPARRDARRPAIGVCFLASATFFVDASAQDSVAATRDTSGLALEEIVVTSRRVEESLQSTPVAVTALSAETMRVRNLTDIRDLAASTPNLVLQTSAANGGSQVPSIYIRGLGQSDVALTADPAVGIYLDGVYLARNSGNILSLFDLERVEVLRGPQGTLFGKNTIGGAISLVSRKPGPDFSMSTELTGGNYERMGGKLSVNVPVTDRFFVQAAAYGTRQDGFIRLTNYPGKELGETESWAARLSARWLPTDSVTVDLSTDHSRTRDTAPPIQLTETFPSAAAPSIYNALLSGNPASCLTPAGQATDPACFGPVQVPSDEFVSSAIYFDRDLTKIDPENDFDALGVNLTVSWDLPFGTLRSISAYRNLRSSFPFEGDYSAPMIGGGTATRQDADQYSEELQLFGTALSDRMRWLAGGYYFQEDSLSEVEVLSVFSLFIPMGVYPLLTTNRQPSDTESYAFFGQATFDVKEWLHLTAGARWTKEIKDSLLVLLPTTPQGLPGHLETDEWTPMLSVSADIADDVMVYASYSQGFRSGGFPPRVIGQVTEIPTYGPETATTYEIGVKAEMWDRRLRTNLALFTNDFEDFQAGGTNLDVFPPLGTVINAGNARIDGVELEVEAAPMPNVRLDGSVSYLTNELSSVNPTANDSGVPVTDDNKLPYAPEWKASAGITWTVPLPNDARIRTRLDAAYTSKMFFSLGNTPAGSQGGGTTLDGSIGYALPGNQWEIVVGGRNLTDRRYFTSRGTDETFAGATTGAFAWPRTYFATVRWNY